MAKTNQSQFLSKQTEFTQQVEQMFDEIAPAYDFLNHALSFGVDFSWRRKTADALHVHSGAVLLDVATGTGDTLKQLVRLGPRKIIGVDLTQGMLDICAKKVAQQMQLGMIELYCCSVFSLPFPNEMFDGATITFGVRNFDDRLAALKEIARTLKPGARLAIAELTTPVKKPFADIYNFYMKKVLPYIGGALSRNFSAYQYLPASVAKFPEPAEFCRIMEDAGFEDVYARPLTFGVCMLYVGKRKSN